MSVSHEELLLLKNATVNRNLGFDDICREKQVSVVYNNEPAVFEVSNITGEMVKYPVAPYLNYYHYPVAYKLPFSNIIASRHYGLIVTILGVH